MRLVIALLIGSIGAVGMWAVVVVIPVVQAEFAATRGASDRAPPVTPAQFFTKATTTAADAKRGGLLSHPKTYKHTFLKAWGLEK